jgi:S-DNA-T family DNA segregation ATPase FtsK/SpoIIIE
MAEKRPPAAKPDKPEKAATADTTTELVGLVLLCAGIGFGLVLGSHDPRDMELIAVGRGASEPLHNLIGPVGARIADLLLRLIGVGAFGLDALVLLLGVRMLIGKVAVPRLGAVVGLFGVATSLLVLAHLTLEPLGWRPFGKDPAGLLPGAVAVLAKALLSTTGAALLAGLGLLTSCTALAGRPLFRRPLQQVGAGAQWLGDRVRTVGQAKNVPDVPDVAEEPVAVAAAAPAPTHGLKALTSTARRPKFDWGDGAAPESAAAAHDAPAVAPPPAIPPPPVVPAPVADPTAAAVALHRNAEPSEAGPATVEMSVADIEQAHIDLDADELPDDAVQPLPSAFADQRSDETFEPAPPPAVPAKVPAGATALLAAVKGPRLIETEAMKATALRVPIEAVQGQLAIGDGRAWTLPPSALLQEPPPRVVQCDEAVLTENAEILRQKLADFNIAGEVIDVRPGPVVTTYEFRPAPGVQVRRIANRAEDLMMSLSALRVRIVAPIPGRDVVGIEVPNQKRQLVYFREIVEHPSFRDAPNSLLMVLGKDLEGGPVTMDLGKAPHLLVAGATGTGKSVGINSFIGSLLYKATPDQLKFIFIDPKMVELSTYDGIPHLLVPVVTEVRKAELALKWAVCEMERRYKLLQEAQVRNLAGYKQKLPELRAAALRKREAASVPDLDGGLGPDAELPIPEDLPYIVIVIDEFADLIMMAGKEVELPVARLAQKARAAGMHVILATQRPSANVLTGMIKANFPTRISFQVASGIDSKVVLDHNGAETLLGKGDMLFLPPGEGALKRCHGTWITDDEVTALAKHWKEQGKPNYDMAVLVDPEEDAKVAEDDGPEDPLYDQAVQCVLDANQASVSFLQRKLGIGYGRSAKIVDQMERRGLVGPSRGPNKPREILALV